MADRVKYFLLGVLFLVVAGVIAYDRWNSTGVPEEVATGDLADSGDDIELFTPPSTGESRGTLSVEDPRSGARQEPSDPEEGARARVDLPPVPPAGGNVTPSPEPRPTPPAPDPRPAPPPQPKTHVIQKGDTLEKLAIRYYGTRDGIKWIAEANQLSDPNRIVINQKLVIPAKKEITAPARVRAATGSQPAGSEPKPASKIPSRYVVKDGDGDLYAICRRFYGSEGQGARVAAVMELNHLWSADVKPGTVLMLPQR